MEAACCVPAFLPNFLSALQSRPRKVELWEPSTVHSNAEHGGDGCRLWLTARMSCSVITCGTECIAMQQPSSPAWGLGLNPLFLAHSPTQGSSSLPQLLSASSRESLKRSLFEVALMEMGLFQRYSNGCLVICSQGSVVRR